MITSKIRSFEHCCGFAEIGGFYNTFSSKMPTLLQIIKHINQQLKAVKADYYAGVIITHTHGSPLGDRLFKALRALKFKCVIKNKLNPNSGNKVWMMFKAI